MYIEAIRERSGDKAVSMLHLGCGAGMLDYHFKQHYSVTGVDLSRGMLDLAMNRNPEVKYLSGDMRTVELNRKYDVVAIPDSVNYMASLEDLHLAISNATSHLKKGGILLIVTSVKEDFRENNFVYYGEKDDVHVTVFENNHIVSESTYEAAIVYLIREKGDLKIYHEVHTLGLFTRDQWLSIFEKNHLQTEEMKADHLYDQYLMEDGEYKLKVLIGTLKG
jgi:SAM-dependent methyltransferase